MAGFAWVSTAHPREDFIDELIDSVLEVFIIKNIDGVGLFLDVGVVFWVLGHEENGNPALERFSLLRKGTDESDGAVGDDTNFSLDQDVVELDLALGRLGRVDLAYGWWHFNLDGSCWRNGVVGFESDLHQGLLQGLVRALDDRRSLLVDLAELVVLHGNCSLGCS